MRSSPHDWIALAAHALDLHGKPVVVLDAERVVRGWNTAAEALLGRARADAIGRAWTEVRGEVSAPTDTLEQAVAQGRREATSNFVGEGGGELSLRVSLATLGEGRSAMTVVTIVDHRPVHASPSIPHGDVGYSVSLSPSDRWVLRAVRGRMPPNVRLGESICYEVLQRRTSPCPGCPVQTLDAGETRTAVLASGHGHEPVRLLSARAGEEQVDVESWEVDDATLWALVEAKVKLLARRADLSTREQDVLLWLLRGRSPQDVATLLGIAPRTVKFHQANVLRKLGAESRADLLRLIF